jgi:hypothetical protein
MAILPGFGTGKAPEAQGQQLLPPGLTGYNREPMMGLRRVAQIDNGSRIAAQIERDRGLYIRPPVGPVEYSEGNIKKSTELTGVAGYNQREIPIKDSPDDMSQTDYLLSMQQETVPQRMRMREALSTGNQNFLNTQLMPADPLITTHNMMNNLMEIAKLKLQQRGR